MLPLLRIPDLRLWWRVGGRGVDKDEEDEGENEDEDENKKDNDEENKDEEDKDDEDDEARPPPALGALQPLRRLHREGGPTHPGALALWKGGGSGR